MAQASVQGLDEERLDPVVAGEVENNAARGTPWTLKDAVPKKISALPRIAMTLGGKPSGISRRKPNSVGTKLKGRLTHKRLEAN